MNQMYDFRQPSKTSSRKTPAYPYQIKLPQKSSVPIFPYFHHFLVMKWDQGSPPIQQFALMASTIAEQQGEEKAKLAMASEEGGVCATPHLTLRKYREISSWPNRATGPAGSVRIRRPANTQNEIGPISSRLPFKIRAL